MESGRKHGKEGLSTDVERSGIKFRGPWPALGCSWKGLQRHLYVSGKSTQGNAISRLCDLRGSRARIEELMEEKRKGNKVIGTFCVYVPEEWIFAGGVAKKPCLKYLLENALGMR